MILLYYTNIIYIFTFTLYGTYTPLCHKQYNVSGMVWGIVYLYLIWNLVSRNFHSFHFLSMTLICLSSATAIRVHSYLPNYIRSMPLDYIMKWLYSSLFLSLFPSFFFKKCNHSVHTRKTAIAMIMPQRKVVLKNN